MQNDWFKLDNPGKLFYSVADEKNSSVFRVSATLSEVIDHRILQKVLDKVIKRFPSFAVCVRKGVFWGYFEKNRNHLKVKKEDSYICDNFKPNENDGYLIRVLYYHNKLTLEVFHSISDGAGALEFFKALLYNYLKSIGFALDHEHKILKIEDKPSRDELEDSFKKYANQKRNNIKVSEKAFQIRGTSLKRNRKKVVHGSLEMSEVIKCAKKYNVTVTVLLSSILIYSIYQTSYKDSAHPIVISIPVNLRGIFPSKSLKNFFAVINISAHPKEGLCLKNIITQIQEPLANKLRKENLQASINKNVHMEERSYAQLTPLFIKKRLVEYGFYKLGESQKTMNLSNLGYFDFPESMQHYIESVNVVSYPTKNIPMNCSVISYGGRMNISFIKNIKETEVIQYFFSYFSKEEGIISEIKTNG